MKKLIRPLSAFAALVTLTTAASAHVSLQEPWAEAGSRYRAVLKIGHGCDGASTTALALRIPAGFEEVRPLPKAGWTVSVQGDSVSWVASISQAELPDGQRGEFALDGNLPRKAGPMWFKALQTCGKASLDWSQVPAEGVSVAGLKTPAALLQVASAAELAQARLLPKVEGAWVRSSVPGQQGTGGFMKLTAPQNMQLVGVATPVAGAAEVHEMKMEGDVMRMRAVPQLDLPAGKPVELKPGGYHLMLLDLKQPLTAGATVPMTLILRDSKGVRSQLELKVPVANQPPGGAAAAPAGMHKH